MAPVEATPVMTQSYARDGFGRSGAVLNDGTKWSFGYNDRSEVTSTQRRFTGGSSQAVGGQQSEYGFDDVGNRTYHRFGGDGSGANLRESIYGAANAFNALTSRTVPGMVELSGEAPAALTLRGFADGQSFSLTRQEGERFFGEASVDNAAWSAYTRVKVVGLNTTGGIEDLVSGARFVPRSPQAFTHDADGNLLADGRWKYTWDAENRLIQVETRPEAVSAGAPRERLLFAYDSGSRRFRKEVQRWNATSSTFVTHQALLFAYEGWNLLGN